MDNSSVSSTRFPLTFPSEVTSFLREHYRNAQSIVEYGSGGSTQLAADLGVPCISVESDPDWANGLSDSLQAQFAQSLTAEIVHIDIGPTVKWGYPKTSSSWASYWRYPLAVWQRDPAPNPTVVLIDGRMRKACFAATLLNIKHETTVLFDDYLNRKTYHQVEQFAQPVRTVGRMAEFRLKPGTLDQSGFQKVIPWFFQTK